jgi:hypothetical protein
MARILTFFVLSPVYFFMGLFDSFRDIFSEGNVIEHLQNGHSDSENGDSVKDVTKFGPEDFRQEAEKFAAEHENKGFDFTVESLDRLDEYAASQMELLDGEADDTSESTGEKREAYMLWFGSYFGEVLVRQFDGKWVADGESVYIAVPAGDDMTQVPPLDVAAIAVDDEPQFAAMITELQGEIRRAESDADLGPGVEADDSGDDSATELSIPSVDITPGMELDTAHQRAIEAFNGDGFYVTEGNIVNSVARPLAETTKLFNFHDDAGMYTGIVYTGKWDDEVTNGVLSLASTIRPDTDGVFVVAATEPPAAVSYLTGRHPRTAFALKAIHEIHAGPGFSPDTAEHCAEIGQELLATHFGEEIDIVDIDGLERLDGIVLSELRTVDGHERPHEGYVPHEALILVGTVAGQIIRQALERDHGASTAWSEARDISSTGVALTITAVDGKEITVNPVGKAFKRFESGSSDSLEALYRTTTSVL